MFYPLLFKISEQFIRKFHLRNLEYMLAKRVANNLTVIGALKITTLPDPLFHSNCYKPLNKQYHY